jgi:CHAT domain-containing protein/Tfp pilus assembly protein PilF
MALVDGLYDQLPPSAKKQLEQMGGKGPLVEQVVSEVEKEVGRRHAKYVDALSFLSSHYAIIGRHADAESKARTALALRREIVGPAHVDFAENAAHLASVLGASKQYGESERIWLEAISIRTAAIGAQDATTAKYLHALALQYAVQARYNEGVPLLKEAIQIRSRNPTGDPKIAELLVDLARSELSLHKYEDAGITLRRGKKLIQASTGTESLVYARLLTEESRLASLPEAENLTKQALAIFTNALGSEAQETVISLAALGIIIAMQGRYDEAHPLQLRALEIRERTLGPDHYDTAESLLNVAGSFANQDKLDLAIEYQKRSVSAYKRHRGDSHPDVALALQKLGWFLWQTGEHDQAHAEWSRAVRIFEERKETNSPSFAGLLELIASAFLRQKKHDISHGLALRALSIKEEHFGAQDPALSSSYGLLATIASSVGHLEDVQKYFGLAKKTHRADRIGINRFGTPNPVVGGEPESLAPLAVIAMWYLREQKPTSNAELQNQAFGADQYVDRSVAGTAVSMMAARQASGSGKLSELIREGQDLSARRFLLDERLITALSTRDEKSEQFVKAMQEQLAVIERKQLQIDQALTSEFPTYDVFANPQPMSVAETQGLLHENEALVKFSEATGLLWAITSKDARWVRISTVTDAFVAKVQALRCGLDRAGWDAEVASRCDKLLDVQRQQVATEQDALPFDLVRAHDLYRSLFGQVEDIIRGKHLLIVPSGPLTRLPFQVLVTQKPDAKLTGAEAFRRAAWLARTNAVTMLPTVSSLKALRQHAKTSQATKRLVGFGNPLLDGPDPRYEKRAKLAMDKQQCPKTAEQRVARVFGGSGVKALGQRGGSVDLADIRAQVPLPETADELCAVARDLGIPDSDIYLGNRATERNIKSMSEGGSLANYRIVHFATHGTLAGELQVGTEPGLILTPPDKGTAEDDGYLSASEIAGLKLDADWVILSACNTAAGGAQGAEALSGLARAFFYAGARSLLVSHWAVSSDSTVKLITKALSLMAADKSVGRSEALRRSMLAMIETGEPHEAHPSYWAPFVVVGEGSVGATPQATSSIVPQPESHPLAKAKSTRPAPSAKKSTPSWQTEIWRQ